MRAWPVSATVLALLVPPGTVGAEAGPPPTFTRDVAPIIYAQCASCHRPGEAGPFSLLSYADVSRHGKQIVMVTDSRFMPPWLPVPGHGEFQGARKLSDDQRRTLRQWYERGMPQGDPADLPALPALSQGWQLEEPDVVAEMVADYTLPADGPDVIRNFVIRAPVAAPGWVEAVEVRPGNKRVVHHAVLKVDPTPLSRRLDAEDGEPGFPGMSMGNAESPDGHIIVWTPGATTYPAIPGLAWRLEPQDDLVLQLHMVPSGIPESVRVRVGLHLTDRPPERETFAVVLREDRIDIPAGAKAYRIADRFTLPVAVDVLGVYPHAHYLGKTMRVTASLPDGTRLWLLRIDDWDFNWQGMYRYVEPLRLPAGATVEMEYTYDNSADNVRNPNFPPRRVVGGNRSTDEMGNLALQLLPLDPGGLTALREANWQALLAKNPLDTGALFNLGVERARRGDHAGAAEYYSRIVRSNPLDQGAHFALAGTYVKLKRTAEAIAHYEQVVRIDPRHVESLYVLGWLLSNSGRFDEAARALERAVTVDPGYAAAWQRLGVAREGQGQFALAAQHFREALRLQPELVSARQGLDRALEELSKNRP